MANPFEGYEDEETRRKRIEEQRKRLGQTEVGSTTEKTYMDGSKTITQTTEIPAQQDLLYRPQQESGQFMRPLATPQNQGQFLPIAPSQNLIEYTRRMESGNNPNIGYHYPANQQGVRKSTAYGPLGITAPQYAEIQRNFPEFRGIPIERANQDQLAQRNFQTFAKQLQALGVEPSESNVSGAHLIGAAGMKRYLETGQLNPEQAAQFGGMQGFENAVKNRMALQPSPASGAAMRQPPAPVAPTEAQLGELGINTAQPLIQRPPEVGAGAEGTAGEDVAQQRLQTFANNFIANQDNFDALYAMSKDDSAPAHIRQQAGERAYELISNERAKEKATRKAEDLKNSGDTNNISKILASNPKDAEGSWLKLLLLGFVSPEAARIEAQKLGVVPNKYENVTYRTPDGTRKVVQLVKRADGKVLGGSDLEGKSITQDELNAALAQSVQRDVTTGAEPFRDATTGKLYYRQSDKQGNIEYVEPGTNKIFSGDTSKLQRVSDISAMQKIDYQTVASLFRKHQGNIQDVVKEYAVKLGRELTSDELQQVRNMMGPAPQQTTQGAVVPSQLPPAAQAPAAQQAAPAVQQGVAQQGVAQQGVAQQGQRVGTGTSNRPLPSIGSLERAGKVSEAAEVRFVKETVPVIAEDANNARQVATIRREQLNIIKTNPSILDIYNGSGDSYDKARNVLTKAITGAYKDNDEFYNDVKKINIRPNERAALEQIFNLTQQVNPKTLKANSGAGAVSNAEQLSNQKANLQNIAELTPLAGLQGINRSKFVSELSDYKEQWLAANQDRLKTDLEFSREWAKEQNKWHKAHEAVAQARAEYLKPYNPGPNATPAQLNAFRDKVFKAFEIYPNPSFDTNSGWSYGTKNSEREIAKKWRESGALR
jgi:hypothetical protein